MRTSDCDILILPSLGGPDEELWLTRWERQLSSARIISQQDWNAADLQEWARRLLAVTNEGGRPAVLVGHGLGALTVAEAVAEGAPEAFRRVAGAFLVAAPDVEDEGLPEGMRAFPRIPRVSLPFPSLLVASRNDPHCDYGRAGDFARSWGSTLVDAGESGHIDTQSGFGPWPEGLMRFAGFLKTLPSVQ